MMRRSAVKNFGSAQWHLSMDPGPALFLIMVRVFLIFPKSGELLWHEHSSSPLLSSFQSDESWSKGGEGMFSRLCFPFVDKCIKFIGLCITNHSCIEWILLEHWCSQQVSVCNFISYRSVLRIRVMLTHGKSYNSCLLVRTDWGTKHEDFDVLLKLISEPSWTMICYLGEICCESYISTTVFEVFLFSCFKKSIFGSCFLITVRLSSNRVYFGTFWVSWTSALIFHIKEVLNYYPTISLISCSSSSFFLLLL